MHFVFSTQRVNAHVMTVERDIFTLLLYSSSSTVHESCADLSLAHIQQTADVWSGEVTPEVALLGKTVVFRDEEHYEN